MKKMNGQVVDKQGQFLVIETDGPSHLQHLHINIHQAQGCQVGDAVNLEYRTTPSSGLWYARKKEKQA